jgi:hypothetical protein
MRLWTLVDTQGISKMEISKFDAMARGWPFVM